MGEVYKARHAALDRVVAITTCSVGHLRLSTSETFTGQPG
jgi:hypothetical protein